MDNSIVISQQTPQQAGITTPKPGEQLWWVVVDDGNEYRPAYLCIANSDKWSLPLDFSAIPTSNGGGGGGGLTQAQTDALYRALNVKLADIDIATAAAIAWSKISKSGALPGDIGAATAAQGAKADTALQPASTLDATKLSGLVPTTSIPSSFTTDVELAAAIAAIPSSDPEVVLGSTDPATAPTAGQRLYVRTDTGAMWVAGSTAWAPITNAEIVIANAAPTGTPGAGQSLYIRMTDSAMWFAGGGVWNPVATQRQRATNTTVYTVATTGSDTTGDGLVTPFATIQKAINMIAALDGNGFTASVSLAPGTYAGADLTANVVGWTSISIAPPTINTATITSPINITTNVATTVRRVTFTPSAPDTSLFSINLRGANLTIRECTFNGGDAAFNHVVAADSTIRQLATLNVSGTFASYIKGINTTVHHSGSVSAASAATFTTFFDVPDGAIVQGSSAPSTPTGTFTGSKYNAAYVGFADSLIPGSTAGVKTHQPLDSDLTAIAGITDTAGLYRKTAAGAASVVPIGATGLASISAVSQDEGRAAIGAINERYVQSRGQNLVSNGSGLLGTNYNFPSLTFDRTDLFAGAGSFASNTVANQVHISAELIPVDPTLEWRLTFRAKNGNADGSGVSAGSTNYSGFASFDADRLEIIPDQWNSPAGSQTTLAVALNPGDTTITLASSANWDNAGDAFTRGLRWWPYVNSNGYSYPPYTYSRNFTRNSWAAGGISGNVITLSAPWTGPALPTGTPIENASARGGTYKYAGIVNQTIPTTWTEYSAIIAGLDTARTGGVKFPPGTAFVKLVFLTNYSPPNNAVIKFNLISLTSLGLAANFPAGNFPNTMGFGATAATRVTIGPGTIQINGGATISAAKSAIAPTSSGTVTVTGALVGEAYTCAATNGSAAVIGICATAGTVTYNPAGFTGAVKASHITIG